MMEVPKKTLLLVIIIKAWIYSRAYLEGGGDTALTAWARSLY